jgi:hypothetical protein
MRLDLQPLVSRNKALNKVMTTTVIKPIVEYTEQKLRTNVATPNIGSASFKQGRKQIQTKYDTVNSIKKKLAINVNLLEKKSKKIMQIGNLTERSLKNEQNQMNFNKEVTFKKNE